MPTLLHPYVIAAAVLVLALSGCANYFGIKMRQDPRRRASIRDHAKHPRAGRAVALACSATAQAAMMGLDDFFYMSTFIFILIIPLIWITRPAKSGRAEVASGAH
jgi:hypothetical protein